MLERFFQILTAIVRHIHATQAHTSRRSANRHTKPKEPTMSAPKIAPSFLDLPPGKERNSGRCILICVLTDIPEIRNRIYTFTTYPTTGEQCSVAPCIALVSTCKQIYNEYRPICLMSEITIYWRDVPRYFQKYFTDNDGALAHIELAPARMTIITNICLNECKPINIDLLPILKFRLAHKSFECEFVTSGYDEGTGCDCAHGAAAITRDDLRTLLAADVATMQKLLGHQDEDWVKDIKEGRIQKLIATHIGTNCCPMIKFYVGRGERGSFSPEFETIAEDAELAQVAADSGPRPGATSHWVHAFSRAFDDYLNRVKIQTAFTDNQYSFLPIFIRSTEETIWKEKMKGIATTDGAGEDTDSGVSVE